MMPAGKAGGHFLRNNVYRKAILHTDIARTCIEGGYCAPLVCPAFGMCLDDPLNDCLSILLTERTGS